MRRAFPGLERPIGAVAIAAEILLVAGLLACDDWETTMPRGHEVVVQSGAQPPTADPQTPVIPGLPAAVPDTALPAVVVDTGPTPGGWLAVDHAATPGETSIYLVRPDGSETRQLTRGHWDYSPAWSPDGSWIAFARYGADSIAGIWVIRPDGSGERRVTAEGWNQPSWLDDGRVAFDCDAGLCGAGVDGSNPVTVVARVASDGTVDVSHDFSPDGKKVAFARGNFQTPTQYPHFMIYVANRDGSGARRLTTSPADSTYEGSPRWSRDGKQIAFSSLGYGVAVADADGGRVHGVSRGVRMLGVPAWSADGTRVVFGFNAREFYIANADGTGAIRRARTMLSEYIDDWGGWPSTWAWSPR